MTDLSVDNPFWQFSLTLYGKPEVEQHCLAFQEETGLNVNILLLCCWAGGHGVRFTEDAVAILLQSYGPWSDEVVKPLRSIRTRMKMPIGDIRPDIADGLREKIKALELEAEKMEQDFLFEALSELPGKNARTAERNGVIRWNLGIYAKLKGRKLSARAKQSIEAILIIMNDEVEGTD